MLFALMDDLPLKDCSSQAKVLFSPAVMLSIRIPIGSFILLPDKAMAVKASLLKTRKC